MAKAYSCQTGSRQWYKWNINLEISQTDVIGGLIINPPMKKPKKNHKPQPFWKKGGKKTGWGFFFLKTF